MLDAQALPAKVRAFVALRLSAETVEAIAGLIDTWRALKSGVGWVRRDNLHLTIRFLGAEVEPRMLVPLDGELAQIAAGTVSFVVEAQGAGAFPGMERPRVLWVGLTGEGLEALARRVEMAAVNCGFTPEPRPYSPHLTIGRVRSLHGWPQVRRAIEAAAGHNFGATTIDSMILYRSILGSGGATYSELARYALSGS